MRPVLTEVGSVPAGVAVLGGSPGGGTPGLSANRTLAARKRERAGLQPVAAPVGAAPVSDVTTAPLAPVGFPPQKVVSGRTRMLTKSPGTITPATPCVWS